MYIYIYRHTHTHRQTYIYIYIYIGRIRKENKRIKKKHRTFFSKNNT